MNKKTRFHVYKPVIAVAGAAGFIPELNEENESELVKIKVQIELFLSPCEVHVETHSIQKYMLGYMDKYILIILFTLRNNFNCINAILA